MAIDSSIIGLHRPQAPEFAHRNIGLSDTLVGDHGGFGGEGHLWVGTCIYKDLYNLHLPIDTSPVQCRPPQAACEHTQ
jgi:hypothetical protein